MSAGGRSTPSSVTALTAVLALAGGGGGLAVGADLRSATDWWLLPALTAVLVAAAWPKLRFQYRDEVEAVDLFEAVLMPIVFIGPGAIAVIIAALAKGVAEGLQRIAPVKVMFNTAQWMAATAAGSAVYVALRSGTALTTRNFGALIVAMFAAALVNHLAVATVIALVQGQTVGSVIRDLASVIVPLWVIDGSVNLAFGATFVALIVAVPAAAPLLLVPLGALFWAHRGYAEARADHARLQGLQQATHSLAAVVDPRDGMADFLRNVRNCFEAEAVDLFLAGRHGPIVHRLEDEQLELTEPDELLEALVKLGRTVRLARTGDSSPLVRHLEAAGWRDCLATPVRSGGKVIGVLATYSQTGLEGFEAGSLAVLEALAAEIADAVVRGELLDAILEERRKFADIVNTTSDGIATIAADGRVLSWNPGLTAITGFTAEEMDGPGRLRMLRMRDSDENDVVLERWVLDDVVPPSEVQVLTRDDEEKWLSCSYTKVSDPEGGPGLLIVMARDATSAHELEKLKADFVSIVSHELRTPLAPIMGWARGLLKNADRFTEDQKRSGLESILRQAQRLEALILNILEVSRIEVGASQPRDEIVDVPVALEAVVGELLESWPGREIRVSTPEDVRAHGSQLWIEQIVTNLLSNALKYSPADEPIDIAVTQEPGAVRIAVTDRGAGIPERDHNRIFERFERLSGTDTQPGTGLGLYVGRKLAEAVGGTLDVESAVDRGSTFTLTLRAPVRLSAVG